MGEVAAPAFVNNEKGSSADASTAAAEPSPQQRFGRALHERYADQQTEHAVVILEDAGGGRLTCAHMNAMASATFGEKKGAFVPCFFGAPGYEDLDAAALDELASGVRTGAGATVHYHCRVAGGEAALFTTTARGRLSSHLPSFPFLLLHY